MGLPFDIDIAALEALPAAEREEVLAQLARLGGGAESNPLWAYLPHPKQRAYHEITAPLGAFVGGNRSGKSFGGTADDVIQVVDVEALPPWLAAFKRWPGECHRRVITPDLNVTLERVVLPLFKKLMPAGQLWRGSWEKAYDKRLRVVRLENGNTIDFLTHDMELDQFSGASLMGIRADEEPKGAKGEAIYRESLMRLIDHDGEFRLTMTPLLGLSWTYHELTRKGAARWDDDVQVVTVDMDDNPHLSGKAKTRILGGMSDTERQARKHGRWVHFAGLIYPEFDQAVHVIPQGPLPRDEHGRLTVAVYEAIDPGIDHPTGWVAFTVDNHGQVVVFDSFKVRHETVGMIAARIHQARAGHGYQRPRWVVIDPSARNRSHIGGQSVQQEYANHGIHAIPGNNDRRAGFNRVAEHLAPRDPQGVALERPRLEIMANNEALIDEFKEYRWRDQRKGQELRPEGPVKINDDLLDPLRYGLMSNPRGLRQRKHDDPPEDPREFTAWEQRTRFKAHLKKLAGRRRNGQPGAVTR